MNPTRRLASRQNRSAKQTPNVPFPQAAANLQLHRSKPQVLFLAGALSGPFGGAFKGGGGGAGALGERWPRRMRSTPGARQVMLHGPFHFKEQVLSAPSAVTEGNITGLIISLTLQISGRIRAVPTQGSG